MKHLKFSISLFATMLAALLLHGTASATDPLPTTIVNDIKLGQGGFNNHSEYFEDYGNTVVLSNGNIVSVWRARSHNDATPPSPDGDGPGVFFRVFDPEGTQIAGPTVPYFDINPAGTGDQREPIVAALIGGGFGGGFALTWNSNNGPGDIGSGPSIGGDTYTRVYDNAGTAVSGTIKVNESQPSGVPDRQTPLDIFPLTDGGFAVVYRDWNSNTNFRHDLFVRTFDANGTPRGNSTRVGPNHADFLERYGNAVALPDGRFALSWGTDDPTSATANSPGPDGDLDGAGFFRVFNADGSGATAPIRPYLSINPTGVGNQYAPILAALTNGNLAMAWNSAGGPGDVFEDGFGRGGDTYTAVFNTAGTLVGSVTRVNDKVHDLGVNPAAIVALPTGGYAVAWEYRETSLFDYFVRAYDAGGAPRNNSVRISPDSSSMMEDFGDMIALTDGAFAVSLRIRDSNNNGTGDSVDGGGFASGIRVFNADGTARTPLFFPYLDINPDGSGHQNFPRLAADPAGGFFATWNSARNDNDGANSDFGLAASNVRGGDTWTRHYNNQGAPLTQSARTHPTTPGELTGTIDEQLPVEILTLAPGRWAVVMRDENHNTGNRDDFYLAILSSTITAIDATVTLTAADLTQTFDGTPKTVSVTTDPAGLDVIVTYNGEIEAPSAAGSYAVLATIDDDTYQGQASGTLIIAQASQTITFNPIPDQTTADTVTLEAAASSGLPVSFSVSDGPGTITDGNQLTFTGPGTVTVTATQGGNDNFVAADPISQEIVVTPASQLELVINMGTEEIFLSGSYQSPNITVNEGEIVFMRLGFNDWSGGNGVSGPVLTASVDPFSGLDFLPESSPIIFVNSSVGDSLTIRVGEFLNFGFESDPLSGTVSITGNEDIHSFSANSDAMKAYLATLDGRTIYFQTATEPTQPGYQNIAPAGILRVIRGPNAFPMVRVGNAGNENDTTGFGGVAYDYYIGKFPVTNAQYAAFLNAVAATGDPHGLWNSFMGSSVEGGISRSGDGSAVDPFIYSIRTASDGFNEGQSMGNMPVNYVSFWDAVRFTNWLTTGNTETGVYELTEQGIADNTITRNETAWADGGVAIASENEWYKAAYYDPTLNDGDGGYWLYPTRSNTAPTAENPPGGANSANFLGGPGTVTAVGAYTRSASFYGTFDQGGNVSEWNDEILFTSNRGLWLGSFASLANDLQSSSNFNTNPNDELAIDGFRVSSLAPIGEVPSLVVTTTADTVNPNDGHTSLREAIAFAATLDGPQTITFSDTDANGAVNFHDGLTRTIHLGGNELVISSDVTIVGPGTNRFRLPDLGGDFGGISGK